MSFHLDNPASGGGINTITGSIAANQVAVGSGANTIAGSGDFTFVAPQLSLLTTGDGVTTNPSLRLLAHSGGADAAEMLLSVDGAGGAVPDTFLTVPGFFVVSSTSTAVGGMVAEGSVDNDAIGIQAVNNLITGDGNVGLSARTMSNGNIGYAYLLLETHLGGSNHASFEIILKGDSGNVTPDVEFTFPGAAKFSGASSYLFDADISADSFTLANAGALKTDTTTAHTALIQAYDVDGAAYTTFGTLTNGNTPSFALAAPAGGALTIAGAAITTSTYNGNTLTAGSSTYTGTAAQTYTFPTTSATIARTDAGPQTFTGAQIITEPVGASGLTITGATQVTSFPALTVTQIWNAVGTTFTFWKGNVTNTASAGASLLIDLQASTVSKFKVGIDGTGTFANALNVASGAYLAFGSRGYIDSPTTSTIRINNSAGSASIDFVIPTTAILQLGQDVNGAAVSQTLQAANGITGTDKTGGNLTARPGAGTGAGAISSFIVQSPTLGTTGTTAQTQATRLTVNQGGVKCSVPLWLDNAAVTGLVAGAVAALTTATIVIYDSTGQAYRVPCVI